MSVMNLDLDVDLDSCVWAAEAERNNRSCLP